MYSTSRKTKIILTGLLIFALIYNIPRIVLPKVVDGKCLNLGYFIANSIFVKIYTWTTFVFNGVIPLCMVIYMNCVIVQTVKKSRQMFKTNTTTTVAGPATNKGMTIRRKTMSDAEHQLIIMLVVVSTLFILLLLPICVRMIYVTFAVATSPSEYASSLLFFQITHKLWTTNNGINFFLYCISGTKFRNDLKEILCGVRKSPVQDEPLSISTVLTSENSLKH